MNIVIYANCQGGGIKHFLEKSKEIQNKYKSIYHIRADDLVFKKNNLDLNYVKNANVFIYQHIDDRHGDIGTNNILNFLNPDCIKISFTYIYNNSFYPVKGPLIIEHSHKSKLCKIIYDNSEVITKLIDDNKTLEEIYELYENNMIDFLFEERWNNTMKILQTREKKCDIKISDYIIQNFKKERLFLIENHPTSVIFIQVVNQILEILKIDKLNINYGINDANLLGILPIDISSKNYFNYEFDIDNDSTEYYKKIIKNIYLFYTTYNKN